MNTIIKNHPMPGRGSATANLVSHDLARAHRDRIRYLDERYERAHTDDAREMIQGLIDSETLRWKLITDTQPQPQ